MFNQKMKSEKAPTVSNRTPVAVCLLALLISPIPRLCASTVYAANNSANQLEAINTTTNVVSGLFGDPAGPRGLIFNGPNDILYTTNAPGTLADYNLNTQTSSVVATFGVNDSGQYLALDPGGASVLVGIGGAGLERFNLSTHAMTNVSNFSDPRGLAYDGSGNLFAVLGPNQLAQINPITGAVINSILLPSTGSAGGNGLAFDPISGHLFVTDDTNSISQRGLYEIPTNLSSATLVNQGLFANGLVADGQGDLWIAEVNHLDEYNTASHNLSTGANTQIFDVALAPSGSTTAAPEPASLLLFAVGFGAIAVSRRR
jgi:DNA-binding beta-propeller fold protein YncE